MKKLPDIDIDFLNRDEALKHLDHRIASIDRNGVRTKHNTGIYVQNIPVDHTNMAGIDYEQAEKLGYFKLDFLNNSAYQGIDNKDWKQYFCNKEPTWTLLEEREIVKSLPHIANHFDIVNKLKPDSMLKLAAVLAIIRPAKRYLVDSDWDTIMKEVWIKPTDGSYFFKKSHSVAYAMLIAMRLNYLEQQAIIDNL